MTEKLQMHIPDTWTKKIPEELRHTFPAAWHVGERDGGVVELTAGHEKARGR